MGTCCKYVNRLTIGGIKITTDGSPPGKTALLHHAVPHRRTGRREEPAWRADSSGRQHQENRKAAYDMGVPLDLDANSDAVNATLLRAHEYAAAGDLVTLVHAQFTHSGQLDKSVEYKGHTLVLHFASKWDIRGAARPGARETSTVIPGTMHTNLFHFPV